MSRRLTNIRAARIGPTVCELPGPMPIENRSKALTAVLGASHAFVLREKRRNADLPRDQPGEVGILFLPPCSARHRCCCGDRRLLLGP